MFLRVNYGLNFNFACQWQEKTSKWVFQQNNNSARASRFFVHFSSVSARLIKTWKCLIFCFMEDVNKRRRIFLSLSKLECGPQEINSREYRCLHLKFSERLKKTRFHFKSDVFAAVAHPCGPVSGPGVPWGFSSDSIASPVPSEKFLSF